MKRALAFLAGVCLAAAQACAEPAVDAVDRIVIPVSDLGRAANFYTAALSFVPVDAAEPPGVALRLGEETIELVPHAGRPLPRDSRSNDRWFQHLAIVVSDIDRAYPIVLQKGAAAISEGIQKLPAWNPNAGGIRAVYFRDPDGHPLELIQFPPGKGAPRWQQRAGSRRTGSSSGSTTARSRCETPRRVSPFIAADWVCASPEPARTGASSRNDCRRCPAPKYGSRACARRPGQGSNFCII